MADRRYLRCSDAISRILYCVPYVYTLPCTSLKFTTCVTNIGVLMITTTSIPQLSVTIGFSVASPRSSMLNEPGWSVGSYLRMPDSACEFAFPSTYWPICEWGRCTKGSAGTCLWWVGKIAPKKLQYRHQRGKWWSVRRTFDKETNSAGKKQIKKALTQQ